MKNKKSYQISLFVILCILLNLGGKLLASGLSLPIWLDSVGTILTAYALGPVCGAVVGVSVNIIYSILYTSVIDVVYALVSAAIGITAGICAQKGYFRNLFGILTSSFLVTIVSMVFSVPLNYFFFDGKTGNLWGDNVIELLSAFGYMDSVCFIVGEFCVDFIDKVIIILLVACAVQGYVRCKKKINGKANGIAAGIFLALVCSMAAPAIRAEAAGKDYSTYVRTVYGSDSGLPGGIANAIVQTNDGILWVGTYGGLYRYSGNDFRLMDEFESVKNVNALYTDEAGRLWIGTNDNGLSICINEKIVNVVTKEEGLPSDSVRGIVQSALGDYYVGTTDSLAVLSLSGGLSVSAVIPEVVYTRSLAADELGNVVAVAQNGEVYLINGTQIINSLTSEYAEEFTCCQFDREGNLYVGTDKNRICIFRISDGVMEKTGEIICEGLNNINSLNVTGDGRMFICADNGAGFLDEEEHYHLMNMNDFNSSIDHMLVDYQGNLWFTSSRLGLLKLCDAAFDDVYSRVGLEEKVVNTVVPWKEKLYFGTDDGLDLVDAGMNYILTDSLTMKLQNTRIRCLMVDSRNHLWICTSGKGVYEADPAGNINVYNSENGTCGDKFRSVLELADGTIAACGDAGITFIQNKAVSSVIGAEEGLRNPKVLCMLEMQDGSLWAGTDGNGIAVIRNGEVVNTIGKEQGLGSGVILRMVQDIGGEGVFVVTSNSISVINTDGSIRILDNFPYYNNYDLFQKEDGTVFVLSSAGIYVTERDELLSGEELDYLLLDSKMGLCKALTANAWNYADDNNNLYLAADSGVIMMNLDRYDKFARSYRMMLKSITADEEKIDVERGRKIVIDSDTERIELTPEIVNYSVNDPYISIWLEGFDKTHQVIRQSELSSVVYTNLPSGDYVLHLALLDNKNGQIISESTYSITKTKEFYENWWFAFYFILVMGVALVYVAWLVFRTQIQKTLNMHKREMELAKHQIDMGNETILTIAQAVDARDSNTSQHSVRVSEYSVMIAKKMGMSEEKCESLRKTALLHDIGKIGIPDSILNKPARLTDEEYEVMKSHVLRGAKILEHFTLIDNVEEGALYHHERYDGKGYVSGLKGEEIPLTARIIGIADAFDAMTANRVYRKQLDFEFVLEELKKGRGTQFDPKLVDIMFGLIDDGTINVEKIYEKCETK